MEITELVEKNTSLLRLGLHLEFNDARHRIANHLQRNIDRSEYRKLSFIFVCKFFLDLKMMVYAIQISVICWAYNLLDVNFLGVLGICFFSHKEKFNNIGLMFCRLCCHLYYVRLFYCWFFINCFWIFLLFVKIDIHHHI